MASFNQVMLCNESVASLYMEGKSTREIAKVFGTNPSRIRTMMVNMGLPMRTKSEAIALAGPRIRAKLTGFKHPPRSAEARARISAARTCSGKGFSYKKRGYVTITQGPNKHRDLHVVIMEAIIGRKLLPHEVVHHIDENKTNNAPENLQLMTRAEHTRLHRISRHQRKTNGIV